MYNNIKKFIDPRYATLFLFCIVSLLIVIFMKSRRSVEMFLGKDLTDIKNIRGDIKYLERNKLNTSDFGTTLASNTSFNGKLNTSDFDTTLTSNLSFKQLQTNLGNAPTLNNISTLVTDEVNTRVGDITQANTDLTNAYSRYDVSMATQYSNYDSNASAKLMEFSNNASTRTTDFSNNAFTRTTAFNDNASTKTGIFDSNYDSKIRELTNLKSAALTAKTDAETAKTDAETAKADTQKMYDDVFKEVSGTVVTQSNVYRDGLKFNPITGFYEPFGTMYEAFETREGFSDAVFNKEREVIQDLNAFNTAYYAWITCKSGKCPTNPLKTEAQLRISLETAANTLGTNIDTLKVSYPTSQQTDGTQATIDKAREIDALRRDLDTKMNAILMSKNRIDEPAIEYDSTVYAGILWSVLGTSVLYYVFTEL